MRVLLILLLCLSFVCAEDKQEEKKETVQLHVQSWLLPYTVASDLKANRITAAEIKDDKPVKVALMEVIKGKDELPKKGEYQLQKILATKGTSYVTYDVYLDKVLPTGTKLQEFVYKGTYTGTWSGETHKYTFFDAVVIRPEKKK